MSISIEDLKHQMNAGDKPQLVDVRSPGEYAAGHVPGAINIPMEEVPGRMADLDPNRPIVLVCQSGTRAAITKTALSASLTTRVLQGGTSAWTNAGLPVVRSVPSGWSLERQMRIMAGTLTLTGVVLASFVHPAWMYLSAVIGFGLAGSGITGICPMTGMFARMPWNRGPIHTTSSVATRSNQ